MMVLESFHIRNFKSFFDATLNLRSLTVLIGANASGKTNLIEAMQLFTWMAEGRSLAQLLSAIRLSLRGSLSHLTWDEADPTIVFGCRVATRLTPEDHLEIELSLRLDSTSRPRVVGEHLVDASSITSSLQNFLVVKPVAHAMRGYSHMMDRTMRADGANVSSVLHQLCEQGHKSAVLDFVRALPEQDIIDVKFVHTELDHVMVQIQERIGPKLCWSEAAVLSNGTLRALAIAGAVLSVEPGSTLVIEDVDNGVHPSRIGRILDLIRREAERRELRVLITTHNPALLDAIPDQELAHVVACYRDPDRGDSRFIELGDMDRFPDLVARGSLGEVVTKGLLERFLKQTPEQRDTPNRIWIESLEDP
jgi:predicted ATPase